MHFWERGDNGYETNSSQNVNTQGGWQDKINEYADKSQDELMQELLTTATRMRGDGTLKPADLDAFYSRVSGFLNEEQRARMRALIDMLKR
ncbi:MAG: hypothetical protein J5815_02300 [Clostridia bacterium]|nr:hypothetical protein [Clostridia bacterium]